MTTVINNPGESGGNNASGGAGVIVGAVVVILVLIIVLLFTVPYFRDRINTMSNREAPVINPTINVQLPAPSPTVPATTK